MPEANQDRGCIPEAIPPAFQGRLAYAINLRLGQVLTLANIAVARPRGAGRRTPVKAADHPPQLYHPAAHIVLSCCGVAPRPRAKRIASARTLRPSLP